MGRKKPRDVARDFFTKIKRASAPDLVYYLYGEESYLLDRAVEAVIELAAPDGTNEFNFQLFRGKDTTGEQLSSAVETLPFMVERRVVLVRDLQEMDLRELADLEGYFADPSPTTCLILHAMTAERSVDGRKSIVRKLKKAATVCEFRAFYDEDVERFVHKQAADRGMRLDQGACAYLTHAVGGRLADLDQALEKLDLYLGASEQTREVGAEQIAQIIAETRVSSIFDLTDALGDKDLEEALAILDQMLLSGEAPIKIEVMIARHFRILARLQDPSLRNAGRTQRARAVGVSPYFLKDYARHARKFSPARVHHLLDQLVDVDLSLKSSKLDDRVILEQLLLNIAAPS